MNHLQSCKVAPLSGQKKFYSVDLLRFLMAIMITYFHVDTALKVYFPTLELSKYTLLAGKNVVIAFFIMSGFFLF